MRKNSFTSKKFKNGRTANLEVAGHNLPTPILFPVACMITGSTPRGGGIWKYILQADLVNGLMRRNLPIMSQVLHFLDFHSTGKDSLDKWREIGIKQFYNTVIEPELNYDAPLFLDSGGFKLLWNDAIDLRKYGLSIHDGHGPETIISLQKDFGGDIIASLDYPLPPGLGEVEIQQRMDGSYRNALKAAMILKQHKDYTPFFFVATHGHNRESIGRYVRALFHKDNGDNLLNYPFGLAIGSLVPLRKYPNKLRAILELVTGVIENIPEDRLSKTPIHVFGITGNLIPVLSFLGIDSFDSSTYVQQSRTLKMLDPITHKYRRVLELDSWNCECRICRNITLYDIQEGLTSGIPNRPNKAGYYKSKYYSDIALHNLEMDYEIVNKTRKAIESDSLKEFLIEHTHTYPEIAPTLQMISELNPTIIFNIPYTQPILPINIKSILETKKVSLKFTPESFNILENGYKTPQDKKILLLIPCSGEKPYSISRSHRVINSLLNNKFGRKALLVHKVTLSGLYGPVPEEYETEDPIANYDFHLESYNEDQISLVTNRLITFLELWGNDYKAVVCYATSKPYRMVFQRAAKIIPTLKVIPDKPSSQTMTLFYKKEYLAELSAIIAELIISEN